MRILVPAPKSDEDLLTPKEVADIFRVDPKTVARWAKQGKLIPHTHTLGGHSRYLRSYINELLKPDAA